MKRITKEQYVQIMELIQPICDQAYEKAKALVDATNNNDAAQIEKELNGAISAIGELESLNAFMVQNTKKITKLTNQAKRARDFSMNKPIDNKSVQERIIERLNEKYPELMNKIKVI
jgi:hypothetical protein